MKKSLGILFLFLSFNLMSQDTIYYVGDPLCSWCYGFAPAISEVKEHYKDKLEFEIIMGGLRPNNTETMADLGDFLVHHWEQVEQRSGQKFNYGIIKDHSFVYDTEPPARAVWVVRQLKPEVEFAFFKDVQLLFYVQNKNTNDIEKYKSIVEKQGIDFLKFKEKFDSDDAKYGVKQDFRFSGELGVQGFPSVLLKKGEEWILIANGYSDAKTVIRVIEKALK